MNPLLPHPHDHFRRRPAPTLAGVAQRRSARVLRRQRNDSDQPEFLELPPTRRRRLGDPVPSFARLSRAQQQLIRPFVFMNLPYEIRLAIYGLLMEDICKAPLNFDNAALVHIQRELWFVPKRPALPTGLLCTNSIIQAEFKGLLAKNIRVNVFLRSLGRTAFDGLRAWYDHDPAYYGSYLTGAHIEHAANPDWDGFFSNLPNLWELRILFFSTAWSDQLLPMTNDMQGNYAVVSQDLTRHNAALKGIVIDILQALDQDIEISLQVPNDAFAPEIGYYETQNRDPSTFPADMIQVPGPAPGDPVYFRPRDGKWEVQNQMWHRFYIDQNLFYEHIFGRQHAQIDPVEIEAIVKRYAELTGTTADGVSPQPGTLMGMRCLMI